MTFNRLLLISYKNYLLNEINKLESYYLEKNDEKLKEELNELKKLLIFIDKLLNLTKLERKKI